ncbi:MULTISPECIES: carboxymuconolactone decarboxylase family protein [unclassified Methylophaga]|jgi:AhpD family alkylhydroperoxidase|uniref:carboxymuconolactone decarboxylase family protein n=1 Tax=unclassified Methylophaga TaxID=2629249 RepID=UPI000C92AB0F|nr:MULTISPECIES: carboxymuconolactone decarboxylase family protein [unclassified Methylophaga]MAK67642.1 alkylhydroperoxidase [Methylophaga sp.]MAY18876.1 alkylhydroperoxidase [Methylophaga sp.]HAO24478.1 carboxymuconolactone decarboxylase family protein [Methylophaga sp.]HCD05118.1 carboxymuconolactone decarboxylase family protein [Methylophaga sp.]|tara:strand:+ start:25004 stop:25465 length:462 start_codon:yes stop_codon:yes gene_type:complete
MSRINQAKVYRLFPALPQGLGLIADAVDNIILDKRLICLLEIRASQINGCGFCLDMHFKHARDLGEDQQRLDVIAAWREVPWFSEQEAAALNLCERLTQLPSHQVSEADYSDLSQHFSETERIALVATIVKINSWNRIVAAFHFIPERKIPNA